MTKETDMHGVQSKLRRRLRSGGRMIKLFSLKQQEEEEESAGGTNGSSKKVQLRVWKDINQLNLGLTSASQTQTTNRLLTRVASLYSTFRWDRITHTTLPR